MHYYAYALQRIFQIVDRTPRIVLMIASGAVASLVMRLLHKPQPQDKKQKEPAATPKKDAPSDAKTTVSGTTAVASSTGTATSSPKKSKQRKAGKK